MTPPGEISLQPIAELPPRYRAWLDPGASPPAAWFLRTPSFGFSVVFASLLAIGPLVFLFDLAMRAKAGRRGDPADAIAFAVVFVPIAAWAARYVWREWRQRKLLKQGRLRVGAFMDPSALVWATTPDAAYVFPAATLARVHVTARHVHRAPHVPGEFEIATASGRQVAIGDASDYDVPALLAALRRHFPRLVVSTAPELDRYLQRWRRGELDRPGSTSTLQDLGLDAVPAPDLHGDAAVAHFMKLLELAGIGCTKVHDASSVGSSLMSIDTPELWLFERPLHVRWSLLAPVYDGLGPRDQNWLDAERRKSADADPVIVVRDLAFSCLVDFKTRQG